MISDKDPVTSWYVGDAEPEDAPHVSALFTGLAAAFYVPHPTLRADLIQEYTGKRLLAKLEDPAFEIIVGGGSGDPQGPAGFLFAKHGINGVMQLLAGGVRPDMRGRSLGASGMRISDALMLAMRSRSCSRADENSMQAIIHRDNRQGMTLLERHGFVAIETPEKLRPERTGLRLMAHRHGPVH